MPESPSLPDRIGDAYESGKAKVREALSGLSDSIQVLQDGMEDVAEVVKLKDDFSTLTESEEAMLRYKGQLKEFGVLDMLSDGRMRELESIVYNLNGRVEKATQALNEILGTSLRFSHDFLGSAVQETQGGLDELNGTSVGLVEWVGKNKTSGPHVDLRLDLQNLRTNLGVMHQQLGSLVDPSLATPTNNMLLNQYLTAKDVQEKVKTTINNARQLARRLQQIQEALDKIKGML